MPIPDHHHRLLQRLIDQAQPKTLKELQQLLNSLNGAPLPDIPEAERSPEDQAFDLVDEAWESAATKGQKLALQALDLWPDCIPAYEYLSAKAKSKQQRLLYIEKGVEIGQRLFGGNFRKQNAGHFWGITETRPYMRCLHSLAFFSLEAGNLSKAIVIWEDMLDLNPSDNQGVRYSLMPALLRQRDLKSYHKYRKQFPEDTAMFYFNDALAEFMENGPTPSANLKLRVAAGNNSYIIPLLLHKKQPVGAPPQYTLHSPEEAHVYVFETWQLWHDTPGALQWLATFQPQQKKHVAAQPLTRLPKESLALLLREPFSPISPLRLRPDLKDEAVADLPFLRLNQELLAAIHKQQSLKLTQKGNLPRSLVHDLYALRLFPNKYVDDGTIKLMSEDDFYQLTIVHKLCEIAKLIQKRKGKAGLTKKGLQMLQGSPALFYQELLKIYTQQYNWAYTESWSFGVEQTGQLGWAFVMYELLRQGDTPKNNKYYGKLYFQLLPGLIEQYPDSPYSSAEANAESDFQRRFFSGFARLFDLVETVSETRDQYGMVKEFFVKRSDLAGRVFALGHVD